MIVGGGGAAVWAMGGVQGVKGRVDEWRLERNYRKL
jgi:hypothetical protein